MTYGKLPSLNHKMKIIGPTVKIAGDYDNADKVFSITIRTERHLVNVTYYLY